MSINSRLCLFSSAGVLVLHHVQGERRMRKRAAGTYSRGDQIASIALQAASIRRCSCGSLDLHQAMPEALPIESAAFSRLNTTDAVHAGMGTRHCVSLTHRIHRQVLHHARPDAMIGRLLCGRA